MRCFCAVALGILGFAPAGCNREPAKPKNDGVNISAPGVNVQVDKGGVEVKAPGVNVNVPK
ncbi:MAG TPA: hypothetical protein VNX28_09780 [Gemmataceae bacterium]|jgi:hypothetical protein|nr:hypothetical protein [Gemmataceae bacterium]